MKEIEGHDLAPESLLVEYCCGLVTVDAGTGAIRLSHYSIYEYFQQKAHKDMFGLGHISITKACLTYLTMDAFKENSRMDYCRRLDQSSCPFGNYAAENWGLHAAKCPADAIRKAVEIFLRDDEALVAWSFRGLGDNNSEDDDTLPENLPPPLKRDDVTPLHVLARFPLVSLLKALPSDLFPPTFNYKTSFGETPLMVASKFDNLQTIEFLISNHTSVNLNDVDNNGRTALVVAVQAGHVRVVQALLEFSNLDINRGLPLRAAVKLRNIEICRLLLKRPDLDVNATDQDGKSAFWHLLGEYVDSELTKVLLERADFDPEVGRIDNRILIFEEDEDIMTDAELQQWPIVIREIAALCVKRARLNLGEVFLHWFFAWIDRTLEGLGSHRDIILQWLDDGFDCAITDEMGLNLVHIAALTGSTLLLRKALNLRLDFNAENKLEQTPLHVATGLNKANVAFQLLDEPGIRIDAIDADGSTPLHMSAEAGNESICSILLGLGADPNLINKWGWSTLTSGVYGKNVSVVRLLLEAGVDPLRPDVHGNTPLLHAAWDNCCDIMLLLLHYGAPVQLRGPRGWTPLHVAVFRRHLEATKLLVENGAEIDFNPVLYGTPLWIASEKMYIPMIDFLLMEGADATLIGPFGRTPLDWVSHFPPVFERMKNICNQEYQPTPESLMRQRLCQTIQVSVAEMLGGTPKYEEYGTLGHALLSLENREHALKAFEQKVSWSEHGDSLVKVEHSHLLCEVCSRDINGSRMTCETCPAVNLCSVCFYMHRKGNKTAPYLHPNATYDEVLSALKDCTNGSSLTTEALSLINPKSQMFPSTKDQNGTKPIAREIPWCSSDHQFLHIPGSKWIESKGTLHKDEKATEAWLRHLTDMYPQENVSAPGLA